MKFASRRTGNMVYTVYTKQQEDRLRRFISFADFEKNSIWGALKIERIH